VSGKIWGFFISIKAQGHLTPSPCRFSPTTTSPIPIHPDGMDGSDGLVGVGTNGSGALPIHQK